MRDPQIAAIVQSLRHLVPNAGVSWVTRSAAEFAEETDLRSERGGFGERIRGGMARFWFETDDGVTLISVVRPRVSFTKAERDLLLLCASVMSGLVIGLARMGVATPTRLAARHAFENFVVHSYLRRGLDEDSVAPVIAVALLQELASESYEGAPCRSGFVFTARAARYLERSCRPYRFEEFPEPQRLGLDFFEQPLSYRYVDGRNAFYLVDGAGTVAGVLRSSHPLKYSATDRAQHGHLEPLLRNGRQRTWVGYVGPHGDVNVATSRDCHLRWSKMRWRLLDASHLRRALAGAGLRQSLVDTLVGALYRISETRLGALVLIPDNPRLRPHSIGSIDDSRLGSSLLSTFQRRQVKTMETSHALIGMLTSDGLTTISKNGRILDAGEIVDLAEESVRLAGKRGKGGGRTQAGLAASLYGLVVKVSEDGPITLFRDGRELVTLLR